MNRNEWVRDAWTIEFMLARTCALHCKWNKGSYIHAHTHIHMQCRCRRRCRPLVTASNQTTNERCWAAVAAWLKAYASHSDTEWRENEKFNDFFFRQIEGKKATIGKAPNLCRTAAQKPVNINSFQRFLSHILVSCLCVCFFFVLCDVIIDMVFGQTGAATVVVWTIWKNV